MRKTAVIVIIVILTAWLNTNYFFYPITIIEQSVGRLFGTITPAPTETCDAKIAAHRGFANNGKFIDSSKTALTAAGEAGAKHIEIDLTITENEVYLRHDDFDADELQAPNLIKERYPDILTLREFFETYSSSFESIIFDIKGIHSSRDKAYELLAQINWNQKEKFSFIGRSCNLLKRLQKNLGIPAGCEAQGVLGNRAMGLRIWSVDYRTANHLQLWLNKVLKLKLVLWTFSNASEGRQYCKYKPDVILATDIFL